MALKPTCRDRGDFETLWPLSLGALGKSSCQPAAGGLAQALGPAALVAYPQSAAGARAVSSSGYPWQWRGRRGRAVEPPSRWGLVAWRRGPERGRRAVEPPSSTHLVGARPPGEVDLQPLGELGAAQLRVGL